PTRSAARLGCSELSACLSSNQPSRALLLLVHYDDLKIDRSSEMRRIAAFLGIEIAESLWPDLIAAAGFDAMKASGDTLLPHAQQTWNGGSSRFLNKGTSGQWQNVFSLDLLARYDEAVTRHFPCDLADWIQHGRLATANQTGT